MRNIEELIKTYLTTSELEDYKVSTANEQLWYVETALDRQESDSNSDHTSWAIAARFHEENRRRRV